MPGIQDDRVIDLVAQDADGRYFLAMVENRPWGQEPDQPTQLRAKINAYAQAIVDGKVVSLHPETAGKRLEVRLYCVQLPTDEISVITDRAGTVKEVGDRLRCAPHPLGGYASEQRVCKNPER
jgi:hypothetical protein